MARFVKIGLILVIVFNLYLCSYSVIHNNILYHTDIARDLLILQEMVDTHKPTLIGPRAGGVDGLFHGPLWPWINLPAFVLGDGNPVVLGWFWIGLVILSLGITYFIARKIFTPITGFVSAAMLSIAWALYADGMYNPSGAMIVSPLFFYFFYQYIQTSKVKYLLLTFFSIGILIQFEVAFGGPMLLLTMLFLIIHLARSKKKKWSHLLAIFILIIPLSTYIAFDVRHDFLQTRSVLSSIGSATGNGQLPIPQILQNRFEAVLGTLLVTSYAPQWFLIFVWGIFIYVMVKSYKNKKLKYRQFYFMFAYFYLGYWPLSFYLNGQVQGYHVIPYLPISIIFFASSYHVIRKELYILFLGVVLYFNYLNVANKIKTQEPGWLFSYNLAKDVFNAAPKEFGYYIFSTDEFGYGPRYAFHYAQKQYTDKKSEMNAKKPTTFVILSPGLTADDKNREWWIQNKVNIKKSPRKFKDYKNGNVVNEYKLTEEETKLPSDPNLIQTLIFR